MLIFESGVLKAVLFVHLSALSDFPHLQEQSFALLCDGQIMFPHRTTGEWNRLFLLLESQSFPLLTLSYFYKVKQCKALVRSVSEVMCRTAF